MKAGEQHEPGEPVLAYTASAALLDTLQDLGVEFIFANFGSDHPGLVEGIAAARAGGRSIPQIVTCPNEMVGMSAAHGYAAATGRPQAVLVHVECGTQALAGAVHNAAKGRIPIFIFAGASPLTQEGELKGSRNEFIQWIQDVHDQRGIVRGYMRYEGEVRVAASIKQLVARAFQFARSDPKGPVYLTGAREIMEAAAPTARIVPGDWKPVAAGALSPADVAEVARALAGARAPLVVTSFVGRNPSAVKALVGLCETLGAGVLESVPNYVNFPHTNVLYQGNQWNEPRQNAALAEADVVLVIDSDIPWIPTSSTPRAGAVIYHIDVDPLKIQMPLWYISARGRFAADAATALGQLNAELDQVTLDRALVERRRARWTELHAVRRAQLAEKERPSGVLTGEYLTARLRRRLTADTLVVNEGISNYQPIFDHLALSEPGMMFTSGGGSLGWHGGAAIGAKLAHPGKTVIALTGDGSYMFSVPSSVHWMARRYHTPFLTVIYNNGGWKSPRLSTLAVHPDGYASRSADLDMSFHPQPDYAGIAAAAGGAFPRVVENAGDLEKALDECFHAVRVEGRCAVLDVRLAIPGRPAAVVIDSDAKNKQETHVSSTPTQLLINGQFVPAAAGGTFIRSNPLDGAVATEAAAAGPADGRRAADAAQEAFPKWAALGPNARRALLNKAADSLAAKAPELIAAMQAEIGATQAWAGFNIHLATGMIREAAALTTQISGTVIPSDKPGCLAMAIREPAGVVLGMAPWNAPVILGVRAIATPLACGNTVVLKASETCPRTHALIGAAFHEAGLPPGVVNVVTNAIADAPAVVAALIEHPAVRRVNFTGSTRVGRIVAELCARQLKPVVLELGGKAPLLVLHDADLGEAVKAAAFGAFMNQGQICMSTERIIVVDAVADDFVAQFSAKAKTLVAGDPREGKTPLGAVVDLHAAQHVHDLVGDAVKQGGRIAAGGDGNGVLMPATVVDYVTPAMRLYREESFGPVVAVIRVKDEEAAIAAANDSEYGLSAAVFSRDIARALSVARRIQSGICHINGPTVHDEAQMPFGGVKASGYGRFGGQAGVAEFTEMRWITIETQGGHFPI